MPKRIEYGPAGEGCTGFTQAVPKTAQPPQDTWLWVHCTDYRCSHARAVALQPWAIRWGVRNPVPIIKRKFRCCMCQSKGANVHTPGHSLDSVDGLFPADSSVRLGGKRRNFESCSQAEKRHAEIYGFLWRSRLQRYWNA